MWVKNGKDRCFFPVVKLVIPMRCFMLHVLYAWRLCRCGQVASFVAMTFTRPPPTPGLYSPVFRRERPCIWVPCLSWLGQWRSQGYVPAFCMKSPARTCLLARVPQIHPSHPAVPSSKVLIGCGGSRCKQRHLNLALDTSTCSWTEPRTLMRSSWIFSDQLHHRGLWYCKVSSWDPSFRHACQKRVVATISLQEFKRAEHMPQIGQNAWRISCYFRQPKRYTPNPRDPRVIMIYPASPSKLPFSGEPHFSRESPFGQPGKLLRFGSTSMTSLVVWQLGLPLPLGCQTFCRVNCNDLKTTPP